MSNVSDLPKQDCTGCGACVGLCQPAAIRLAEDSEGFLYPQVNREACNDCGACYKRCPSVTSRLPAQREGQCFAVQATDAIRLGSSSGGAFPVVARALLAEGAVVCGAVFQDHFRSVRHVLARTEAELLPLRGSKYVQSDSSAVFPELREALNRGTTVFYVGVPCQVAGLKAFLGRDYPKLYTADLICHGIPSPGVFRSYVDETEQRQGSRLVHLDHRDKSVLGWGRVTALGFEDGTKAVQQYRESPWDLAFITNMTVRPCCEVCPYAGRQRVSDLTLGDFWGVTEYDKSLNDGKGISVVFANTEKGEALFQRCAKQLTLARSIPPETGRLRNPRVKGGKIAMHPARRLFFRVWRQAGFHAAVEATNRRHYDVGMMGFWHAVNYGAMLTGYALQRTIEELGYSCTLVSPVLEKQKDLKKAAELPYVFARRYLSLLQGASSLAELNAHCDMFVSASDQLWNGELTKFNTDYLLAFASDEKKKISCATSFGDAYNWPETRHDDVAGLLRRYDHLSVRERRGLDILQDQFQLPAEHLLDPVFYPGRQQYDELVPKRPVDRSAKYLLAYLLSPSAEKGEAVLAAAERLALTPRILLSAHATYHERGAKALGPKATQYIQGIVAVEEFLDHFRHAEFVLTDSFHGTCFSLLFERNFVSMRVSKTAGNERARSMLMQLGLEARQVEPKQVLKSASLLAPVDYARVTPLLERERKRAVAWLKHALEAPKGQRPSESDTLTERVDRLESQVNALTVRLSELERRQPVAEASSRRASVGSGPRRRRSGILATLWKRLERFR